MPPSGNDISPADFRDVVRRILRDGRTQHLNEIYAEAQRILHPTGHWLEPHLGTRSYSLFRHRIQCALLDLSQKGEVEKVNPRTPDGLWHRT